MSLIRLHNITRTFQLDSAPITVLKNVDFNINPGELVALVGPSGSGKSTLLQIAGLLEPPTSGEIYFDGNLLSPKDDLERTNLRRHNVGFVYQFHYLLPEFTALDNVVIPQLIMGTSEAIAIKRAKELLSMLKLDHRFDHLPKKLSGGEQQRVAIARALANQPKLILADEPTGNLDQDTAKIVFDELLAIVKETGLSALVATHDLTLAKQMDRRLKLSHGQIEEF
jgi:lipoprotein-releasing system ATP-binding protein